MSVMFKKSVTPTKRRTYASQFKREAVELIEREGVSVAEAARRLGVEQTLLRSWKRKFQELGDLAFPGAGQRTAVEEENRQLREENARLPERS